MSENMLEKMYFFIAGQGRAVPALELVQNVLELSNATKTVAENIVLSLVKNDPRFSQNIDGSWHVTKMDEQQAAEWVLCKIYPSSSNWQTIAEIRCSWLRESKQVDELILSTRVQNKKSALTVLDFIGELPIILSGIGNQLSALRQYITNHSGDRFENPVFTLKNILNVFFPGELCRSEHDIAKLLGLPAYLDASSNLQFEAFAQQVAQLFELLQQRGIKTFQELAAFCDMPKQEFDFNATNIDSEFIDRVPESSGVYVMRNKKNNVIYVGKAGNLKRRLRFYFAPTYIMDKKLQVIRDDLYDIEILDTGSELEALLLEYDLIKRYQPDINSQSHVHSRVFLKQQRFPQIVLLPALQKDHLLLLLFNPMQTIKFLLLSKQGNSKQLENEIKAAFFDRYPNDYDLDKEEIITSWLSKNHEMVSRIDMRLAPSIAEAYRLAKKHISHFNSAEKSIQL